MSLVLLIDFGSTFTKVTAVDVNKETVLGTAKSHTTVKTDITIGLNSAVERLYEKIGVLNFDYKLACSSAAGGLKMIAVGLVPELTSEAARRACLNAGAKLLKTYSYELSEDEALEIAKLNPDIILLTGGTNGGNKNVILHNARIIESLPLEIPIIVSGNKSVSSEVVSILKNSKSSVIMCENVMPEFNVLNIEPTQNAIRDTFLKRIILAKGLSKTQAIIDGILMPTPSAVLKGAHLLSVGHGNEKGIGDLLLVDIGGATTDVYSIADGKPNQSNVTIKGLPEPFAKRTVEGDLGLRYTSKYLLNESGIENIISITGYSKDTIINVIDKYFNSPEDVSNDDIEVQAIDLALSIMATKIATSRHCGTFESHYTPFGEQFVLCGKDLRSIKTIVGTGGPFVNSTNPVPLFESTLFENDSNILKPISSEYLIDKKYILAGMGLLAEEYPEVAIRIMKKELVKIK